MRYILLIYMFLFFGIQEVFLGEEGQFFGVQVDLVNYIFIVNDEMELIGVFGLVDEFLGDFVEL